MGRKPDLERRRQIVELRAQGWSQTEIGKHLGISRQAIFLALQANERQAQSRRVHCRVCDGEINPAGALRRHDRAVLCPNCLAEQPYASFADQLRTHRLAAGWTAVDLERRSGVNASTIYGLETGRIAPRQYVVSRLFLALGVNLASHYLTG
jgi:transcriptional regulator with XRE-family HTH domain